MLRDHGRFKYSAIVNRPDYTWPEGKRLAFYVALNMEHFSYGEGLGISMSPGIPHPNTYNWAWREYGNRVGVWRLLDLFADLELPISVLLNSELYDHSPEVVAAFRARGDEIVGHGRTNSEHQNDFDEAGEAALIREATEDHRQARRQTAGRLAQPRGQPQRRDTRPPAGGRLHLHPRLADGRSAGVDQDPPGPAAQPALSA